MSSPAAANTISRTKSRVFVERLDELTSIALSLQESNNTIAQLDAAADNLQRIGSLLHARRLHRGVGSFPGITIASRFHSQTSAVVDLALQPTIADSLTGSIIQLELTSPIHQRTLSSSRKFDGAADECIRFELDLRDLDDDTLDRCRHVGFHLQCYAQFEAAPPDGYDADDCESLSITIPFRILLADSIVTLLNYVPRQPKTSRNGGAALSDVLSDSVVSFALSPAAIALTIDSSKGAAADSLLPQRVLQAILTIAGIVSDANDIDASKLDVAEWGVEVKDDRRVVVSVEKTDSAASGNWVFTIRGALADDTIACQLSLLHQFLSCDRSALPDIWKSESDYGGIAEEAVGLRREALSAMDTMEKVLSETRVSEDDAIASNARRRRVLQLFQRYRERLPPFLAIV